MFAKSLFCHLEVPLGCAVPMGQSNVAMKLSEIATARREFLSFAADPYSKRSNIGWLCDMAGIERTALAANLKKRADRGWPVDISVMEYARDSGLGRYVENYGKGYYVPYHIAKQYMATGKFFAARPYPTKELYVW